MQGVVELSSHHPINQSCQPDIIAPIFTLYQGLTQDKSRITIFTYIITDQTDHPCVLLYTPPCTSRIPSGNLVAQVTVEKNRISTVSKAESLKSTVKTEALSEVNTCETLLKADMLWPNGKTSIADFNERDFTLSHEEMAAAPDQTMMLRMAITFRLFDDSFARDPASLATVTRLLDSDPYLAGTEDIKAKKEHVVQHLQGVLDQREQWQAIKTVRAPALIPN